MADGQILVPVNVYGKTRVVAATVSADARDFARREEESNRIGQVSKRRLYYDGEQYAEENLQCARAEKIDPRWQRLPEHKRKHAYSTQIAESIDYLADRLGEGWSIVAVDGGVQAVLDAAMAASDQLSAEDEDGALTGVTDDALREALQCGDVAAYVGWDPVAQTGVVELWESEKVEFRWSDTKTLDMVIRTEQIWASDDTGMWFQTAERKQYEMLPNAVGQPECHVSTFWGDEEVPREGPTGLGIGRIPWAVLRAQAKGLRDRRGQSAISDQIMEAADRLNASMQTGWLIARYNSHGNLAVIGDGASLQVQSHEGKVHKDIADVLTFPGGTALQTLSLTGDTEMLRMQVDELKDSIVNSFGLVRVDPQTWSGLGAVSGYALEILNTRTESTFKRVRRQWRKDWTSLVNLLLDVVAWKRDAPYGWLLDGQFHPMRLARPTLADPTPAVPELPPGASWTQAFWEVTPDLTFPDRTVKVSMGTGYIVDDVKNRDDFAAGLVSQRWALRARGLTDAEIDEVQTQQDEEKPKNEGTGVFGGIAYGGVAPAGTSAGQSLANVTAG